MSEEVAGLQMHDQPDGIKKKKKQTHTHTFTNAHAEGTGGRGSVSKRQTKVQGKHADRGDC